ARARGGVGRGAGVDRAGLEAVILIMRGLRRGFVRPPWGAPWFGGLGRAVPDDAAVDPAPRQFTAEPAELDLRAAVHDDFDAGRLGPRGGRVVADSELHPYDRSADRDRGFDDLRRLGFRAKDIDHVDRVRDVA